MQKTFAKIITFNRSENVLTKNSKAEKLERTVPNEGWTITSRKSIAFGYVRLPFYDCSASRQQWFVHCLVTVVASLEPLLPDGAFFFNEVNFILLYFFNQTKGWTSLWSYDFWHATFTQKKSSMAHHSKPCQNFLLAHKIFFSKKKSISLPKLFQWST